MAYVQALLQGEGINCFLIDVHMSVLEGSIGILPKRVMIAQQDEARARRVLRDLGIEAEE